MASLSVPFPTKIDSHQKPASDLMSACVAGFGPLWELEHCFVIVIEDAGSTRTKDHYLLAKAEPVLVALELEALDSERWLIWRVDLASSTLILLSIWLSSGCSLAKVVDHSSQG